MAKISGPSGTAVAVSLGGAVLLYSGIKGSGITSTLRAFLAGKQPDPVPFVSSSGDPIDASGTGSAAAVVAKAKTQLDKPYAWAQPVSYKTANPSHFDCSGLCGWAYYQGAGISLRGHNTNAFYAQLSKKPLSQVSLGDLVYFGNTVDKHHVGLYVGDNSIIEAPDYGIPVRIRSLTQGEAPWKTVSAFPGGKVGANDSATSVEGGAGLSGNKALGRAMAASYGWTGAQWDALDKLWTRESSWNNHAENPSSGAYGIAQALPASKYPSSGRPPTSSAATQIQWGLSYIKSRYGNPVNAWAHETSAGWY